MNQRPLLYSRARESFWLAHAVWPLLLFAVVFMATSELGLDRWIAHAWYFDGRGERWLGSGDGDWWAHRVLHDDGRWLVRAVAAAAIAAWLLSFGPARLRHWRTPSAFVAVSLLLAIGAVGALKAVTNVDCPWDLAGFGGENPYVTLFAHRPDYLPQARCFPGAHASSGFALFCFYFLWRDHAPMRARLGLWAGLAVGTAFSIGQEARGAHFLSHDLASAAIVWFVQLALYLRYRKIRATV